MIIFGLVLRTFEVSSILKQMSKYTMSKCNNEKKAEKSQTGRHIMAFLKFSVFSEGEYTNFFGSCCFKQAGLKPIS